MQIIYSNCFEDIFYKDWEKDCKETLMNNMFTEEEITKEMLEKEAYALNEFSYDDVMDSFDYELNGRILIIARLGLWNGKKSAYKIIKSCNMKDIFISDCDYCKWFHDGHNIKSIQHHHDGTNYLEYREIKEDKDIDNLLDKLYQEKYVTRKMINYYTKSLLPVLKEIYG